MIKDNLIYIEYFNKQIEHVKTNDIEATLVLYEVPMYDLQELAEIPPTNDVQLRRMFLHNKDTKVIDLVSDNIPCGRVVQGGYKDGKFLLSYYNVKKGLEPLLDMLMT